MLTHLFLIMDMSLAETEGHTRTHKQARPIFDSGRDDKNKQGQRGESVYGRVWYTRSGSGESKNQHLTFLKKKCNYLKVEVQFLDFISC